MSKIVPLRGLHQPFGQRFGRVRGREKVATDRPECKQAVENFFSMTQVLVLIQFTRADAV
jgi:hypothetical protein